MKYKLAIFDMDGTILNTLEDLTDSVNASLEQYGLPKRTEEEVCSFVGNGIHKLIERAVPAQTSEERIEEVYHTFAAYYKLHCADKTKPYEGISKLLADLRQQGIRTAVVSNKADFAVQDLCRKYFDGLFDAAVGEKPGVRCKPAPDSVNTVLKQLQLPPEAAVYIGDSEVDIETANNAGMKCISVGWGFRDAKWLQEQGAKMLVSEVGSLREELLQQLV